MYSLMNHYHFTKDLRVETHQCLQLTLILERRYLPNLLSDLSESGRTLTCSIFSLVVFKNSLT